MVYADSSVKGIQDWTFIEMIPKSAILNKNHGPARHQSDPVPRLVRGLPGGDYSNLQTGILTHSGADQPGHAAASGGEARPWSERQ
ncbi:hypothetical protein ACFSQ7_51045 [Paenibacillus rhizoplanae]